LAGGSAGVGQLQFLVINQAALSDVMTIVTLDLQPPCPNTILVTLQAWKGFQQGKTLVKSYKSGFSPGKNNNEIKHSHRVLLEILDPDLENTIETL